MQPITCRSCGNRVLAEKYSEAHTSIQWLTDDSKQACPRIRTDTAAGHTPAWVPSCTELHATIDDLAFRGELPISHRS